MSIVSNGLLIDRELTNGYTGASGFWLIPNPIDQK